MYKRQTITRTLREEEIRRFGISLVEIDNASKAVEIDKLSVLEKHALDQARELLLLQGTTSRV